MPQSAKIDCKEIGSTLRFLLPIVCALGIETTIHMSGRLPYRPLSPLWEELERMGCSLDRPMDDTIHVSGKLKSGDYHIAGNVSSQFISGLLFALALLDGESRIHITENLESKPYIAMTQNALKAFQVDTMDYRVQGSVPFRSPGTILIEGDWSNAAFFIVSNKLGSNVTIQNLNPESFQGDRSIIQILDNHKECPTISAADIPDLIPILAVYFAVNGGAVFTNISRLRLKESDRVETVLNLLRNLGITALADEDTMWVSGGRIIGGIVDANGDHRIAMAAAIAATSAENKVIIKNAQAINKSYPDFFEDYKALGGNIHVINHG